MRRRDKKREFLVLRDKDPLRYYTDKSYDGVAPINDPKDEFDKYLSEKSAVSDWMKTATKKSAFSTDKLRRGDDPPDFLIEINGALVSVEVTQLIDGTGRAERKRAFRKAEGLTFQADEGSHINHWDERRFFQAVQSRIDKKSEQYSKPTSKISEVDILLIESNEYWLLGEDVDGWLKNRSVVPKKNLGSVHLLLSYDPAIRCRPLFVLY